LHAKGTGGGRPKFKRHFKYRVAFFNIKLNDAERIYPGYQVDHFIIQVKQAQAVASLLVFSLGYGNQAAVKSNISSNFSRAAVKPGIDMP
jgi:hypothetical protein